MQDPSFEQSFIEEYKQQVATAAGVPPSAVSVTGIQSSGVLVQTQVQLPVSDTSDSEVLSEQKQRTFKRGKLE